MKTSILVPVDFSAASRQAYNYALALAQKLNAPVTLLHILPASSPPVPYVLMGKEVSTEQTRKAEARLRRWGMAPAGKKLAVNVLVREANSAATEIADEAEHGKYTMIVMGAKGATNVKEKWMGTVTQKVIASAGCPVLAVPSRAEFNGIKRVMFAADYWKREFSALRQLEKLLLPFKPRIFLTHISTSEISSAFDSKTRQTYIADAQKQVKELKTTFIEVTNEDVIKGLSLAVKKHDADLLVMITEEATFLQRLLLPSLTRQMSIKTRIPLLALKSS